MIKRVGRQIVEITMEADALLGKAREAFMVSRLEELERTAQTL